MDEYLEIQGDRPVEQILESLSQYFPGPDWWNNPLRNRNSKMLGLSPKNFENNVKIKKFLDNVTSEFLHMIIFEYLDESLIVMRRKLCWEISDIFYLPLRVKNYIYKQQPLSQKLVKILHSWSHADFLLYKTYNETLWKEITRISPGFWKELEFYRIQKNRLSDFCDKFVTLLRNDSREYADFVDWDSYTMIPKSPWGQEYRIDYTWCLMTRTKLHRNMARVYQYPELCNHITSDSTDLSLSLFGKSRTSSQVRMNPVFCSKDKTSTMNTFQVPLQIILNSTFYNL